MDLFVLRLLLPFLCSWVQDKHNFCYHIPIYRYKNVLLVCSVTVAAGNETIGAVDNLVNSLGLMQGNPSYMDDNKGFDLPFHILVSPSLYILKFLIP